MIYIILTKNLIIYFIICLYKKYVIPVSFVLSVISLLAVPEIVAVSEVSISLIAKAEEVD